MSELELLPQDKKKPTSAILKVAAFGTVLAGVTIAPNLLQILAKFISQDQDSKKALRAVRYAKSQGWLTLEEAPGGVKVALTESGRLRWTRVQLEEPLRARKWDGKWRIVLFDIPLSHKFHADTFRLHLKRLGLRLLQQSVWITPYSCETQIAALRQLYEIKPFVRVIEVNRIEGETELKKHFKLR